jgi:hypothetical protein
MHTVVIDLHIYLYTYIFHVGIIVVAPVEKGRNGDGSKVGFYGGRTNKYLLSLKQMKTELQNLPF